MSKLNTYDRTPQAWVLRNQEAMSSEFNGFQNSQKAKTHPSSDQPEWRSVTDKLGHSADVLGGTCLSKRAKLFLEYRPLYIHFNNTFLKASKDQDELQVASLVGEQSPTPSKGRQPNSGTQQHKSLSSNHSNLLNIKRIRCCQTYEPIYDSWCK